MLNITAEELDDLRLKLLASVLAESWLDSDFQFDCEQHAKQAAEHLRMLSEALNQSGQSFALVCADSVADAIEHGIRQRLNKKLPG